MGKYRTNELCIRADFTWQFFKNNICYCKTFKKHANVLKYHKRFCKSIAIGHVVYFPIVNNNILDPVYC